MGITAEIGNIQNKSVHIFVFSVEILKSNGDDLSNLQNKLVCTPFIKNAYSYVWLGFVKGIKILK